MKKPVLGILGWEDPANEQTIGSLARPDTFRFPVLFERVRGACYETVIANPSDAVLASMIEAAGKLEAAGASVITTSCGFNAIFQSRLASALKVPVFASSLILIPMVHATLGARGRIGIIAAVQSHLTDEFLRTIGVPDSIPVCVYGIERTSSFAGIALNARPSEVDAEQFRRDLVGIAREMQQENEDLRAILLEMTILHLFADDIRKALGLPVFDIVSLANFVAGSVGRY